MIEKISGSETESAAAAREADCVAAQSMAEALELARQEAARARYRAMTSSRFGITDPDFVAANDE